MSDHTHIAALATLASGQPGWHWYAIADSAQDVSLPGVLASDSAHVRCLLGATQNSPLAEKSPHLVGLNRPAPDDPAWRWIAAVGPRLPCVTLLASELAFDELFEQLQQFTEVRLPDDYEMFFGFWDPAILGTLLGQEDDDTLHVKGPVLDATQRRMLCGGLAGWWYWDRLGGLHSIALDPTAPTAMLERPLMLTQLQVDDLVEAGVPDHVLYFIHLNQPHLLKKVPPLERYEFVARAVAGARAIGLTTMNELVNYVCAALIYGVRWHQDASIQALLARVRLGELKFVDAMEMMP